MPNSGANVPPQSCESEENEGIVSVRSVACILDHVHCIREVRGLPPATASQLLGRPCLEVIVRADRDAAWHQLQRLSLCGPPLEMVVRTTSGLPWRALLMQLTEDSVVVIGTPLEPEPAVLPSTQETPAAAREPPS